MNLILDIETTGLNPLYDRITCIGVMHEDDEEVTAFYGEDEKYLLERFWLYVEKYSTSKIIGFNSYRFDIRFIQIRSMFHNIAGKCLKKNYIDLMYELGFYNKCAGTLSDYLQLIGLEKNGSGFHAIELYRNGNWDDLVKYCKNDVLVTKELYKRCVKAGVL